MQQVYKPTKATIRGDLYMLLFSTPYFSWSNLETEIPTVDTMGLVFSLTVENYIFLSKLRLFLEWFARKIIVNDFNKCVYNFNVIFINMKTLVNKVGSML